MNIKKLSKLLFVALPFLLSGCFEENERIVMISPTEQINEKLRELRDLQREINDVDVEAANLQAKINDLILEINNLIPPGNVPLTLSVGLISAADNGSSLVSGAQVSIDIRGVRTTATSDNDGQVLFEDLRSGVAIIHVSSNNYTDVSFVVDLLVDLTATTDASNSGEDYNVTTAIALYPTNFNNGALRITGNLYYDPDRTDDWTPADPDYALINFVDNPANAGVFEPADRDEYVDGVYSSTTTFNLDARVQSWENLTTATNMFVFVQPNPAHYQYVPIGTEGNIILAIYEEMFVTTTSGANGAYTINIPKSDLGNDMVIHFSEILGTETYNRAADFNTGTGTTTFTTRDREVIYTALYGSEGTNSSSVFYPTNTVNDFDIDRVNNFEIFYSNTNRRDWDFYFGAKTKDE